MDRPFMPKYGTLSQVLLQLVVAYNLLLSLLEESVKSVRPIVWLYFFLGISTGIGLLTISYSLGQK